MSKYDLWIAHWRCDTDALQTANGGINCTQFIDANGRIYYDGIPSLMLWSWKKFLWPCFFFSKEKFNAITIIDTTKIEMVDDVGNLRQERR